MRRNKKISIYKYTYVDDELGGKTKTDEKQKDTFAEVMPLNQKESLRYGLEVGERAVKFNIRYDVNYQIDQNYYITFTGYNGVERRFRIISIINPFENNENLTIIGNERTD